MEWSSHTRCAPSLFFVLYLCTAKAVRTLKVCAYVRAKDKFLRKTKKNLHISKKCSTFAAEKVLNTP